MELSKLNLKKFLRPLLIINNGDGDGNGYGNGNGDGDGYGYGNGVKTFNKHTIHIIDSLQIIITSVKGDTAKGFILQKDLTLKPCCIVRNNYHYSHGSTLKEAIKSLEDKTLSSLPINKRIENFKTQFKNFNLKQKALVLYDWHFKLTGSCKMGRDNFLQNHNINIDKDKFTINEFIELTKNSYGGEIIKQLVN